ncbi:Ca(2+)-dependent cysteine protease [Ceratobasidium sp. 428]|nr:Ca(2+)-dependent cysteine protease [Ceratobasidium sp. 428]
MGKSSNAQTGHGPSDPFANQPVASDKVARSNVQLKHPCTSTLTASLTSRPPSPLLESPSIHRLGPISAEDEDEDEDEDNFHDASDGTPADSTSPPTLTSLAAKPQRISGLQQAPLSVEPITRSTESILYEGDFFYDASDDFHTVEPAASRTSGHLPSKPQRASVVQQAPVLPEGASKGRVGVPPRGSRSTSRAAPSATYSSLPPGRGSSRPAASSIATPSTCPPFGTLPVFSSPAPSFKQPVPSKKALLIGMDYRDTKTPLRYATKDAVKFGKVLKETLQFPEENILFVTDKFHEKAPPCVPISRRNQAAVSGWNPLSPGSRWQGQETIKDKKRFVESTRHNMIQGFRWLVDGAKAGDDLWMLFSGHCSYFQGEPYLVTTGAMGVEDMVSNKVLIEELVLKVPKGCTLQIVFDCCNSAALVDLQYCVGSMCPDLDEQSPKGGIHLEVLCPEESESEEIRAEETATAHHITSKPTQAPVLVSTPDPASVPASASDVPTPKDPPASVSPEPRVPTHGSLYGLPQVAPPQDPLPPGSFNVESFSPPVAGSGSSVGHRAPKRPGGVVAAPPPANTESSTSTSTSTGASLWSLVKEFVVPTAPAAPAAIAPAASEDVKPALIPNQSAKVRQARNFVTEAPRPIDYFKERKEGFVKPAGEVIIWAAAGAHQSAFEASCGKSGIVTGALCKALEVSKNLTRRDLWVSLRGAIESENAAREARDLAKDVRPDPKQRVQHAEMWVSQVDPLYSAAPVLDKPAFCPVQAPVAREQVAG